MKSRTFIVASVFMIFLMVPHISLAQSKPDDYHMLAPIPVLITSGTDTTNIDTFIPGIVKLIIGLAAAFAVLKIIEGGIQYMSTDAISGKTSGRDTIYNAVLGLILTISAYTILNTINPRLLNISIKLNNVGMTTPIGTDIGTTETTTGTTETTTPVGGTGCSNCVPLATEIPKKKMAEPGSTDGLCKYPGPCVVTPTMESELNKLNSFMPSPGRGWQVTEAFPPTVHHIDSCHSNGSCVDATVSDQSIKGLVTFFTAVEKAGITSYEYEVCGDPVHLATLLGEPSFKSLKVHFKCETSTTGSVDYSGKVNESVHLNQ